MSSNLLGELVANNGTYYLCSEDTYTGKIDQIIVRGENVTMNKISVIRNGELVNVLSEYLSSNILPNGLRITPQNGEVFADVRIQNVVNGSGLELVLSA